MKRKEILALALTVILLGGLAAHEGILGQPSADTRSYHDTVRRTVLDAPYYVGTWAGDDRPVPRGAVALLRPNVILSRRFEEVTSGRSLELLIVHCQDARDLLGHYPPICYKAQGWVQDGKQEKDWVVDGLVLKGMEYTFTFESLTRTSKIVIVNFMVLPGGEIARGMDEVNR